MDPFIRPLSTSPMHGAAKENNVSELLQLIGEGKSVNGSTLLHYAVISKSRDDFDFLVTMDETKLDAEDCDGFSPFLRAVQWGRSYFARKLIEKGADVNCVNKSGRSALHFITQAPLGQLLIEKGAIVNWRDDKGETPLCVACRHHEPEVAHMLLFYGADPTICGFDGTSPLAMAMVERTGIENVLFDHTFDQGENTDVNLKLFEYAMKHNSPLFDRILELTSNVIYDEIQLVGLENGLRDCNLRMFRSLLEKFDYLVKDFFQRKGFLNNIVDLLRLTSHLDLSVFVDFLYMVFASPHVDLVVQNSTSEISIIPELMWKVSLDTLSGLICCMMSYGVQFSSRDLDSLYSLHKYCELFRIMTHVELSCTRFQFNQRFVMSMAIWDVRCKFFDVEKFLRKPLAYLERESLLDLLKYFAFPKFKQYCIQHNIDDPELLEMENVRLVPSLVELSRNVARKYIIKKNNVQTCAQFNSVLNKMQVGRAYARILTYDKELY